MLMRGAILIGVLMVLLSGCGSDEDGGGSGGSSGDAKLSGPLTYERGGGIAGRRDRLVVRPDGSATLTVQEKPKSVTLTDDELDAVITDVESADLGSLPADSTTEPPVPDAFGYRIAYGGTTVTTDDPGMPKELRALAANLGGLVERYEK
jgi:hypothetical protein